MESIGTVKVNFSDPKVDLLAKDLTDYLYLYRTLYAYTLNAFSGMSDQELLENPERYAGILLRTLHHVELDELMEDYVSENLEDNELVIEYLSLNSPLSISFKGMISALVVAVIISGGKMKGVGFEFELQPIGDGLAKIVSAFAGPNYEESEEVKKVRRYYEKSSKIEKDKGNQNPTGELGWEGPKK